jgi:hypothetical protein
MSNPLGSAEEWAAEVFGRCELGDVRRTKRLVDYAGRQMRYPNESTNRACEGDDAVAEASYRLLRNEEVTPEAVEAGPFAHTRELCRERELVLAIQDTTTLRFPHASVREEMGERLTTSKGRKFGGMLVHSTLMVDARNQEPLGLIDQARWIRDNRSPTRHHRKRRPYEDKESFKWERSSRDARVRLGDSKNIIWVCDREADVFEYLRFLTTHRERFVVRACYDRRLRNRDRRLKDTVRTRPVLGVRTIDVGQRGKQVLNRPSPGRPSRVARLSIRSATVNLQLWTGEGRTPRHPPVQLNVVYARERRPPQGCQRLEWLLLTSEPAETFTETSAILSYYESRWQIEDFHKAWKSGCGLEQRRLQSAENLERLMTILAPIAVRLLQLRHLAQLDGEQPCNEVLSADAWRCLWARRNRDGDIPADPPSAAWAMDAIARLGGWRDTKGDGRIGWISIWRGWQVLQESVTTWQLARRTFTGDL